MKSRYLGAGVLCVAALTLPASPVTALPHAPTTDARTTAREQVRDARADRREARAERRESAYRAVAVPAHLQSIAACESGGNPRAIGGGGLYRGKYQFDLATWASVGGSGDPAAASEAEQDMRAAMLYERAGSAPWPVCG